jgi:Tol biopolymer transport system component/DNA-binding winged helix-turn-helix (wHTH) protein
MPNGAGNIIRFGLFEADLQSGELRRNGYKVRLQEQPFQILTLLLQKPGEVVSREELRALLWPADTFVDFDHGLNAAIKRLRDALGDSAENPRFIETLARRGYRFIAPAETPSRELSPPNLEAPRRFWRCWRALAVAAVVLVAVGAGWHAGRKSAAALRPAERRLTANPPNDPIWSSGLSPDGKYVAFVDKAGIFLRILGTGETHIIAEPDDFKTHQLSWFPDGTHVLATRGKWPEGKPSLWSVSVLGGSARKLTDDAEQGAISPDGTRIALVRGDYDRQELWIMDADGQHPRKLLPAKGGEYGSVTWSRDSRRLVFFHYIFKPSNGDGEISIEVCDPDSAKTDVILTNSRLWNGLAWTPDDRLIYSLQEPPPNPTDSNLWAWKMDPHTYRPIGEPVRLTAGPDGKAHLNLTADGKRLTYLRMNYTPEIYVAQVAPDRSRLGPLQRLSLGEQRNFPYDWTPDGKSIIFTSNRNGSFYLFKQALDQPAPELLVGDGNNVVIARMDAAGTAVLYLLTPPPNDLSGRLRLMRVPLSGGVPQLVLAEPAINNFQCSRWRANVCIFSQFSTERLTFYRFDSSTGQESLLKTIQDSDWFLENWTLSPDGSTLAISKKHRGAAKAEIRLLRIDGSGERTLPLDDWFAISFLDWAADGKSLWVNAADAAGTATLLNVNVNGKVTPALQEKEMVLGWAIPSRDGSRVALWRGQQSSNAWLLEGF